MNEVIVKVPATTANLGPGFDCLGLAVGLHNHIHVARSRRREEDPFLLEASDEFFHVAKFKPFSFRCRISGDVPRSRGLGSSVTVRLGLLHGLNQLCSNPLSSGNLLQLCSQLEGHPDNAAPAALGGFVICRPDGEFLRVPVKPSLRIVLLIPARELATADARKVLPARVGLSTAARTGAHCAWIGACFASGRYELLAGAFRDGLHQPGRKKLLPFLDDVMEAGVAAGAVGGWLSGSGSTIACLALSNPRQVARAMAGACPEKVEAVKIVRPDNVGVRILR
jgi:homoserine kinase